MTTVLNPPNFTVLLFFFSIFFLSLGSTIYLTIYNLRLCICQFLPNMIFFFFYKRGESGHICITLSMNFKLSINLSNEIFRYISSLKLIDHGIDNYNVGIKSKPSQHEFMILLNGPIDMVPFKYFILFFSIFISMISSQTSKHTRERDAHFPCRSLFLKARNNSQFNTCKLLQQHKSKHCFNPWKIL